jgi:MFS family permease
MQGSSPRQVSEFAAWLALAILVATQIYATIDRQVFMLVAADMSNTLHLSNTRLGLIQGLGFTIFTVAAAYPIAWLADRYDRRWVLAACVLCWSLGTAACGLTGGFATLFVASAAVAVSEAGIAPIFIATLPELFHGPARVTANMVSYLANSLGTASGYFLVGALIALVDGLKPLPAPLGGLENWRLAFLVAAAPCPIFMAMLFWLPIRRTAAVLAPAKTGAKARAKTVAAPMLPFLKVHLKSVTLIMVGMTAYTMGLTAMVAWIPVSLTRIFGLSAAYVGMVMGTVTMVATVVGITAGNFLLRYLQRRLGYRAPARIVWVSLIGLIPLICLFPFARAPWQIFALVAGQVVLSTIAGGASLTFLQDLGPPGVRARLVALRAMTNGPAVGLAISGGAALADVIDAGPESLFWGGLCIAVPAWLLALICLLIAERPYEATARESTGLQSPLDYAA